MKKNIITLLISTTFILTACQHNQTDTDTHTASDTQSIIEDTSNASQSTVTFSDKNNTIRLSTHSGDFQDKSEDPNFIPAHTKPEDVLILQYDSTQDLSLSVIKAGTLHHDINTLFENLKTLFSQNKDLDQTNIQLIDNQKIIYSYHIKKEPTLNESCIIQIDPNKTIMNICASSPSIAIDDLANRIKNIEITQ